MKNAIITGASTGIGKATAILFAKNNYKVFLIARSEEKLNTVAKEIKINRGTAEVVVTDLNNIDSINKLISTVSQKVDTVDALINIAGIWHGKDSVYANIDFKDFDQKTILETYTIGFTAPTLLVHGLLPKMKMGSKIVNLSGTFENGAKGWLPYYASKRAIEDLTIGLSQELLENNIQVNCVSPSDTATESYEKYFPQYMDEAVSPNIIAEKILKLCSEDSDITGKIIVVKKDKNPIEGFHN